VLEEIAAITGRDVRLEYSGCRTGDQIYFVAWSIPAAARVIRFISLRILLS
jgi:hypothetical protein